jgi:Protein of unknown function (DUF3551)
MNSVPVRMAAAALVFIVCRAQAASPHPWCMIYQDMTGATACYYDSYDQCRVSAAGGNGGTCLQNPAYRAPARPGPGAARTPRPSR